jgi:hypothetical protein
MFPQNVPVGSFVSWKITAFLRRPGFSFKDHNRILTFCLKTVLTQKVD